MRLKHMTPKRILSAVFSFCLAIVGMAQTAHANEQEVEMIRVIAKFDVKLDQRDAIVEGLRAVRDGTAEEPGAIGWDMYVAASDPDQFWVDEKYRDEVAVAHHQSQPYIQALAALAGAALSGPPSAYMLNETIPSVGPEKSATDQDDPLTLFFVVPLRDGTRTDVIDRLAIHVQSPREKPGKIRFDAFTLKDDPNTLLVHEAWRKPAVLWATHFGQDYAQKTGEVLSGAVDGELPSFMHVVLPLE